MESKQSAFILISPSNKVNANHIWGKQNRKSICGIYKITSPSGRIYIGQSVNILDRWRKYKIRGSIGQVKLHNSFMKYGASNHKFEIIHTCANESLNEFEEYYMNLFKAKDKKIGLNIRDAGSRGLHSEESKKLIGDGHRDKFVSEETRLKISISKKGKTSWNKGIRRSQETIDKHRKQLIGKKHTEEHKRKISLNNALNKRVLNIETGIYYHSTSYAAKTIGISGDLLRYRMSGKGDKRTNFIYA